MRIENDVKLDFKDVLIRPKRSTLASRSQVSLERTYQFKNSGREWTGVPVMAANMDTTGTFAMAEALSKHGVLTCMHKHYAPEAWTAWAQTPDGARAMRHVAVSAGSSEKDRASVRAILDGCDAPFICLDVANGYSESFVNAVRRTREAFADRTIVAGNVVTGEMTEELLLAGADVVKVGIGPGSVCTTRKQTGVGYPQLSATIECADAAHGLAGCADATRGGGSCARARRRGWR